MSVAVNQSHLKAQQSVVESGSYLTFNAESMHFAIPASQVRYITAQFDSERKVHNPNGNIVRVFQFEQQTVSCFSFAAVVGVPSSGEKTAALRELLQLRRRDHIEWIHSLQDCLQNDLPFTLPADPHHCSFGRWYDSFSTEDPDLQKILGNFDVPHKQLHALAERLLTMKDRGRALNILETERHLTLGRLLTIFDDAERCLRDMQRRIAVIINVGSKFFAIALDHIGDLVNFSRNQLDSTSNLCRDLPLSVDIISSFYHQDEGPLYLVVDVNKLAQVC